MVKADSLKKRYVAFALKGVDMGAEVLKHAIYSEALRFFGELGLSTVALKLVAYDHPKKIGILRCERSQLERVLGFLALISNLDGAPARLIAIKSSGTIKTLQSELQLDITQPK